MIKNILINFPTNLGDTILALPVLDRLRANYLQAKITAIVSPRTIKLLSRNNFINEVVMFNKSWSIGEKIRFSFSLRGKYDLVADLKNSFLPVIIKPKLRTAFIRPFSKDVPVKEEYLFLIREFTSKGAKTKSSFILREDEKDRWRKYPIPKALFVACSSLSLIKRYPYEQLKVVVEELSSDYPLVVLGEEKDRQFYRDILTLKGVVDLVGKTQMADVFYLLKNYARLLLCVDSSILHLASYLNLPIVAIFGPTTIKRFQPQSDKVLILTNKNVSCIPCEKAECVVDNGCMKVPPQEVLAAVKNQLQCGFGGETLLIYNVIMR